MNPSRWINWLLKWFKQHVIDFAESATIGGGGSGGSVGGGVGSGSGGGGNEGVKAEEPSPDFVFRRRRPIRITRARSTVEGALKSWVSNMHPSSNPIHRAPSRLYQLGGMSAMAGMSGIAVDCTKVQPTATATIHPLRKTFSCLDLNVNMPADPEQDPCCGPEFIVKSSLPPHTVILNSNPKKVNPAKDSFRILSALLFLKFFYNSSGILSVLLDLSGFFPSISFPKILWDSFFCPEWWLGAGKISENLPLFNFQC